MKIYTEDKGVLNFVWELLQSFFSYMWIYTILKYGYLVVKNYSTKLSEKSKEKVMFMILFVSFLFLVSAIILQGTSMFLYLQYKFIK